VRESVAFVDLLREAVVFPLRGTASRAQIDIPMDLWALEVDRSQIGQVLGNLVINAAHAMSGGGVVEVTARNVEMTPAADAVRMRWLEAGRYVKIEVRDTGTGIPPAHLSRVFDPFFTTKQGGSGLGLATAYSIVSRHGGHITVESTVGRGTAFTFWLPAVATPVVEAVERERAQRSLNKDRLLVMDDDVQIRRVFGRMLRSLGQEVTFARNGDETLAAFRAAREAGQAFDLLICDLTIPGGKGGVEVLQAVRELDSRVPVIACSGYSSDGIMADARNRGFNAVLRKPFSLTDLHACLAEFHRSVPPSGDV
jgi:CheY-like chemotaxis protein